MNQFQRAAVLFEHDGHDAGGVSGGILMCCCPFRT